MIVAQTILAQLGGARFSTMTGASVFVGGERSLQFSLPKKAAKNGANKVRIVLGSDDLYRVEFWRVHGANLSCLTSREGVYADALRQVFTNETGLEVSL